MRLLKILIGCCLLLIVSPSVCGQTGEWVKRYDGMGTDTPQRVKAYGDGVYLTSTIILADGLEYAVFTKFDRDDGSIIWQYQFLEPSVFNDFAWNPDLDEFILVGATTEPGDNQSLLARMTDTGILIFSRVQEQEGREALTRIVRHPSLTGTDFPYVAVGFRDGEDLGNVTVLFNFSQTLDYNWQRAFIESGRGELEVYRGLIATTNGDVVLLGNLNPFEPDVQDAGAAVRVNATTGTVMGTRTYQSDIVWNDGVQLENGELLVAGDQTSEGHGQLGVLDPLTLELNEQLQFKLVNGFSAIGVDNSFNDSNGSFRFYTTGTAAATSEENDWVYGIKYTPDAGIEVEYVHFLDLNGVDASPALLSVTPADDRIYYADRRVFTNSPDPLEVMTVASTNLDFKTSCIKTVVEDTLTSALKTDSIFVKRIRNFNRRVGELRRPEESDLVCTYICEPAVMCSVEYEVISTNCLEAEICATITGPGPFTFAWNIDCIGSAEYDTPCFTHTFDDFGTQTVCLLASNGDSSCVFTAERFQFDLVNEAPVFTCPDPSSISLNTDPGECSAIYDPGITATDDCTPTDELVIECSALGVSTPGLPGAMEFEKGVTVVICTATDAEGNSSRCTFGVEVTDNEPPTVVCPPSVSVTQGVCAGDASVNFADPVANDNCPMFTVETSASSGDEFPIGTTPVTYTVTDMSDLTASCSFNVTVNEECLDLDDDQVRVWCDDDPNTFNFVITGNDLAIPNGGECSISVTVEQNGVEIHYEAGSGNPGPGFTINGEIILLPGTNITEVTLLINASCNCNDGEPNTDCVYPVTISLPCCREIGITGEEFCQSDGSRTVNLTGCESLPAGTVVNWFKAAEECPDYGDFGTPFATTTGCEPMTFFPTAEDGNFCLYAQVAGNDFCDELLTDIETFTRCAPVTCSIAPIAICINPGEMTEGLELIANIGNPTDCEFNVQWSDANGEIGGATNVNLPVGALSLRDGFTGCAESFVYTAAVSSACEVSTCTGIVTLTNAEAPIGELFLVPAGTEQLCVGDDARLQFVPNCAGDPAEWYWQSRTDEDEPYFDLPGTGTQNPFFNTNALSETTWYRVRATNGACAEGYVEIRIEVIPEPEIYSFSAEFTPDPCDVTGVALRVDFGPDLPPNGECYYKAVWYRDLEVIGTDLSYGGSEDHVYAPPSGQPLNGNYYVEIYSSCCDYVVKSEVISLLDPIVVGIAGPVLQCNGESFTLEAVVTNLPPDEICTFKWFEGDTFLGSGESIEIPGWRQGPITLIVDCGGGCVYTAEYVIINCGPDSGITGGGDEVKAWVAPNPSSGIFKLRTEREVEINQLIVTDANGVRRLIRSDMGSGDVFELDLGSLPSGIYYLTVLTKDGQLINKTITRM